MTTDVIVLCHVRHYYGAQTFTGYLLRVSNVPMCREEMRRHLQAHPLVGGVNGRRPDLELIEIVSMTACFDVPCRPDHRYG